MPTKPSKRPAETLFALILVVFSAAAFWQSYTISGLSGPSTPGVFPMLASAAMAVSAAITLFRTARRSDLEAPPLGRFFTHVAPRRHLILLGLILLYVIAMPQLGFLIASGLFLFAAFVYLRQGNHLMSLTLAAGSLAVVYFVFRVVFQVVLPKGTLLQGLF